MKKGLLTLVFFLGISYLGFSQEKESDVLTSGKWRIESMQVGNEKLELSNENHWMEFHTDGKYQLVLDQQQEEGTWSFSEEAKEIKFDERVFKGKSEIKKLTNREFLFSVSEGDVVYTMTLKK